MARITSLSFVVPVRDIDKSALFYCDAFGLEEVYRGERIVFVGLLGTDVAIGICMIPRRPAAALST